MSRPEASKLTAEQIVAMAKPIRDYVGVYFLINDGHIVYIGQSVCITSRVHWHFTHTKKQFDSYAFVECTKEDLDVIESIYIHTLRPHMNMPIRSSSPKLAAPLSLEQLIARGALVIA